MAEGGDLQKYFSDLDADFIGLKKVRNNFYDDCTITYW